MKLYIPLLAIFFQSSAALACLQTYQFKIFPVGVSGKNIVTVDVQVVRTDQMTGNRQLKQGLKKAGEGDEMYILYSAVSVYDQKQHLLSTVPADTGYVPGSQYEGVLDSLYTISFGNIVKTHPSIELFAPVQVRFCHYRQQCSMGSIWADTVSGKNYYTFGARQYEVQVIHDTAYYAFGKSPYHSTRITDMYLNSVRIYRTKTLTLVVPHLATGHEILMGMITSDPGQAGTSAEGFHVVLTQEYEASFAFGDIRSCTYAEPVLHHGYGYDFFVVQ